MSVKYTHRDSAGMLWRFEGGRPVSKLADEVMRKVNKDMKKDRTLWPREETKKAKK